MVVGTQQRIGAQTGASYSSLLPVFAASTVSAGDLSPGWGVVALEEVGIGSELVALAWDHQCFEHHHVARTGEKFIDYWLARNALTASLIVSYCVSIRD